MNPSTHSVSIYRFARLFSIASLVALCALGCNSVPGNSSQSDDDGRDTLPGTIDDGGPSEEDFAFSTEAVNDARTEWEFSVTSETVDLSEFTFTWTKDDGTEFVGATVLITFDEGGLNHVRLTVLDADDRELFVRNIEVDVPEVNVPPVANAGEDRVAPENEIVFLYGDDSSDPEGRTLSFVWSQVSGPEVLLTNAEQETATFTSPLVSEDTSFEFRLVVSDGETTNEDSVTITIQDSGSAEDDPDVVEPDPDDGDVIDDADSDPTPCDEIDTDSDGVSDCDDGCPQDSSKSSAGACGCGVADTDANANGIPDCVDIVVAPDPATLSVSAGADTSVVEGASTVLLGLAVNGTPPYTYTWSPSDYLDDAQSSSPTATPPETMSFTLSVNDSLGNSAQASVNVVVVAPLVANAGPNVTIPPGGSTQLTGSATGGFTPYTYTWSPQSGLSNPNIANPVATPNSTRTYTLTVRDVYGRSANDGVLVTVSNSTLSVNAGADVTVPTGGSTQLAAIATGGTAPYTYQWTPQSGLSNPNIANPVAQPNSSRSYTVTVTDAASNTATDSVYVTVSNFTANAGADVTITSGGSTTLTGSASGGTTPYTYQWSPSTGLNNSNIANPVSSTTITRTYTLTVTDAQARVATDSVVVTVVNFTANAGADVTITSGGSTTLTGSASGGTTPYTYQWSPSTGLNNPNIANPVASPTTTRTYTLTVTDSQARVATDTVVVTVVNFTANAGADVSIQTGGSTTLSGSASGGTTPYTYQWSPATGLNNSNIASPVASPTTTRTYTLTVTDALARVATDSVVVTVVNFTANAGPDVTIAVGGNTTLSGSASGGSTPYTYQWSPTTGLSNALIANPVANPLVTTTYTLTARDSLNRVATDTVTVTVQAATAALSINPTSLTFSSTTSTATFNVWNSGGGTLNYSLTDNASWLTLNPVSGSSTGEQDVITATVNRTGLTDGSYEAVITVTPSVGSALTVAVTMIVGNPGFGTMSTASRTSGVAPLAVFFDAVSASSGVVQPSLVNGRRDYATFQYRWNFGDNATARWSTDNDLKNEAFGQVAAHVFETPGTFNVTLAVTQANGAVQSYQQQITVTDPEVIYANSSPSMAERTFYVATEGADTNNGSFNSPFRTWNHARTRLFAAGGPRRILLKRGQTFQNTTNSTISNRTGPYTIGAYGTGANPVLQHMGTSGEVLALEATATDVRMMDINIVGTSNEGNAVRPGINTLMLRCGMSQLGNAVSTSDLFGNRARNFIVECNISNNQRYGIYYNFGEHVAIMGNTIDDVAEEHLLRCYITHSTISHNIFRNGHTNKHQLKFCGYFPTGNSERAAGTPTEAVEHSVISDNRFENSGPINWVVTIGPVDQNKDQRIENCLFERNYMRASTGTSVLLYGNNNYITVRNNIFDTTGADSNTECVRVTRRGIEPDPVGYSIYNNTMYRSGSGNLVPVQIASMARDTTVRNNLGSGAAGTMISGSGVNLTQSNNLLTNSAGFVNAGSGDFRLQSSSPAIDAGTNIPGVNVDYAIGQRPLDGNNAAGAQWDLGAFEFGNP